MPGHRLCRTAALVVVLTIAGCGGGSGGKAGSPTAILAASSAANASASTPATPVRAGRIVYRRSDDGSERPGSLYVSNTDGSAERRLTDGADTGLFDTEPTWSPDGKEVVFSRFDSTGHRIAVVSAEGSGLHYLSPTATAKGDNFVDFYGLAAFSPNGTQIAYNHAEGVVKNDQIPHSDVMVMNSDGSHKRSVTHLPAFAGDIAGVRWSPDGKRLLYSLFTANTGKPAHSGALFVIGVDGTAARQLTPWALGAAGIPAWSKSGLIAFRAVQDDESGVGNFYSIHPDGSGLTQITHFVGQTISHQVGISPDGQWIVYSKKEGTSGPSHLMIARVSSPDVYPVGPADRTGSSPDWDPAS